MKNVYFFLVDILLNATGNAPIMKQRKWTVDCQKDINWVCKFIHKYLKLDPEEKLVSKNKSLDDKLTQKIF